MDIRVVALRALTLCAVSFTHRILETALQELEVMSQRHKRRLRRRKHTPLRLIQGGRR